MKDKEEFVVDPITCVEEEIEVGKVNGIVYKMVMFMREKPYADQLILYSAFMEVAEELGNGRSV